MRKIEKTIKVYETRFVVKGCGPFPISMLRYDTCFPATSVDASLIERSLSECGLGSRTIQLLQRSSYKKLEESRWASFGWQVIYEYGEIE